MQSIHKIFGAILNNPNSIKAAQKIIFENTAVNSPQTIDDGPGWRYVLCAAAATLTGAAFISVCEAGTLGVGSPVCLAGGVIIAADALAACAEKYLPKP